MILAEAWFLMGGACLCLALGGGAWGEVLYVGPGGLDTNTGARPDEAMATVQAAVDRLVADGAGAGDEVRVMPGRYLGQRIVLDGQRSGGAQEALLIRAAEDERPVFDGGRLIDWTKAVLAEDELLSGKAKGQVYEVEVSSEELQGLLVKGSARLSQRGQLMRVSRYPNEGFGHVAKVVDKGAVYAHGRTKGEPPRSSLDQPIGGKLTLLDCDVSAWAREFERFQKALLTGYLSHDWYRESHSIARIDGEVIWLQDYSRYGVLDSKPVRRVYVSNLLCELDAPGEFFYDAERRLLLFWPWVDDAEAWPLTVWAGDSMIVGRGASHVRVENLVFQGVVTGRAVIDLEGCEDVVMAGCVVRNSSRPGVRIVGGERCGVLSCDLYDLPNHLLLEGGDPKTLEASGHFAENCHFTQVEALDDYGRIQLNGVGQVFRNNLVHHFSGQVMVVGGNDHLVERNELFHIGYLEGDGGAIYSGSQMWSWGNIYRQNFLHHLMCAPELHPRGGIYPDDGDMGDTVMQNLFYKAAHRAVLINGGGGQTVRENVFLNGYIGIYNTESFAQKKYEDQARFDGGELKRGDKNDMVWRTEQAIGEKGWATPIWRKKYPKFAWIMAQEKKRFWPIGCDFSRNFFSGNVQDIQYRVGSGAKGVKPIEHVRFIKSGGNRAMPMRVFEHPATLDFRYKAGVSARGLPDLRFESVGLYVDDYRGQVSDPSWYRKLVVERFAGRPSYDPDGVYDPATVHALTHFNTGRLLLRGDD